MRVKITQRQGYGDREGVMHPCGEEMDVSDDLAIKLISNHLAVPVREVKVEKTVVEPPEKTAAVRKPPKAVK